MAEAGRGDHVVVDDFDFSPLFATHATPQLDVAVTPTRHMITMPKSLQGSPNPVTRRMLAMALADEVSRKPTPTVEDTWIAYDMASSSKARKLTPKRRRY
ncbi:hypothetical protein ZWY2020_017351 [Hordeum vulgare]|nr:hypothetical protein ZWY2020_017351 [Hordeum vulgare]